MLVEAGVNARMDLDTDAVGRLRATSIVKGFADAMMLGARGEEVGLRGRAAIGNLGTFRGCQTRALRLAGTRGARISTIMLRFCCRFFIPVEPW